MSKPIPKNELLPESPDSSVQVSEAAVTPSVPEKHNLPAVPDQPAIPDNPAESWPVADDPFKSVNHTALIKEYRQWIESQEDSLGKFEKISDNQYALESRLAAATISFYLDDLVEIMINTRADNAVKYYLHFQLNELEEGKKLFEEMMEAFRQIEERKKVKVLIACTSGATSGYFAHLLNEAAQALNLNYEFDAAAYWRLYEAAVDADIVMLAPQIGYRYDKVKKSLPKKLVLMTPTSLFAANDTYNTLQFLDNELSRFRISRLEEGQKPRNYMKNKKLEHKSVLCLACIYGSETYRTYYQLWDGDTVVAQDEVSRPIKYGIVHKEIIESIISRVDHLDLILLGLPGVVADFSSLYEIRSGRLDDIKKRLERKYHIPVWVMNSANAAAIGFSRKHPEYKNILFHSQPYGAVNGGQGIICDHHLVSGKNGLCGEVMTFLSRMQFSNNPRILCKTDIGMLEIVCKALLPSIGLFGPDIIALRSPMTSNVGEVKGVLSEFIDSRFIPEIVYIENMEEYLLAGLKEKSTDFLKDEKKG